MTTSKWPLISPHIQFFDNSGLPLSSGFLVFSNSGTSTARAVYYDPLGDISLGSVVYLDGEGRTKTMVYLDAQTEYRVVLKDKDGNILSTSDNQIGASPGIADKIANTTLSIFSAVTANSILGFPSGIATMLPAAAPLTISSSSISVTVTGSSLYLGTSTATTGYVGVMGALDTTGYQKTKYFIPNWAPTNGTTNYYIRFVKIDDVCYSASRIQIRRLSVENDTTLDISSGTAMLTGTVNTCPTNQDYFGWATYGTKHGYGSFLTFISTNNKWYIDKMVSYNSGSSSGTDPILTPQTPASTPITAITSYSYGVN